MNNLKTPTRIEIVLGSFLKDIGQFMQRAMRNNDPTINIDAAHSPNWTDQFFQWMENEDLSFPKPVNGHHVRAIAAFCHPSNNNVPNLWLSLNCIVTEADQLASGLEQRQDTNYETDEKTDDVFIKTPLLSAFCQVDLGLGKAELHYQTLDELIPDDRLIPTVLKEAQVDAYPQKYQQLWQQFADDFKQLCQLNKIDLFCEGLFSLSERYMFAIPAATIGVPDISLHDRSRTIAALATCLHAWHDSDGSLEDIAKIKNRTLPKFRFLIGDLSGIQHTLFILANQQVKGVNKILRARSFLMGMLLEAAILRCRLALDLPVFNLLQHAGGRFLLLIPHLPNIESQIDVIRREIDSWLRERYFGELALHLALSEPFSGNDLSPSHFPNLQAKLSAAIDAAKQRAFRNQPTGILPATYHEMDECTACGVRPAAVVKDDVRYCHVCNDEHTVGHWLPKSQAVSWQIGDCTSRWNEHSVQFFGHITLTLHEEIPRYPRNIISGFRFYQKTSNTTQSSWPLRFVANYVPVLQSGEKDKYTQLDEDSKELDEGDIKTFEMLAQEALEPERLGRDYLAVLKADVDRLGMIFGFGLQCAEANKSRATLSRFAALSRMMDIFFTGYLMEYVRKHFSQTYTVYAGGDDLLLIGPWRQTIELATHLNKQFRAYTGANPNITLSAGLSLMKANQPLNRMVWEAEERLERAKNVGRARIDLIDDQSLEWSQLDEKQQLAEKLNDWLRNKTISTALVYKVLYFAEQRHRAEQYQDVTCANWRARWAYHLARNVRDNSQLSDSLKIEIETTFNRLLGLDMKLHAAHSYTSPRIPVSIALYRNRD